MAACGDDNKDSSANDTTETTVASAGDTITLVATDFTFDKATLSAKADQEVTFKLTNNGSVEHNLTIKDINVDKDAEVNESAEQTVTPKAGTYEYHCEYHPSAMKGTLTVS